MMTAQNLPQGWEGSGNGLVCNADPVLGGIIDRNLVSGQWFVVFNADDISVIEDIASRDDAFRLFQEAIDAKYVTA
jgi:F420-dependent methylenetetrahydromethanopterin dehydrogenase